MSMLVSTSGKTPVIKDASCVGLALFALAMIWVKTVRCRSVRLKSSPAVERILQYAVACTPSKCWLPAETGLASFPTMAPTSPI